MSLASFPRAEVVYDVDTSCEPAKMVLTFRGPSTAPLGHAIDPKLPPSQKKPAGRRPHQQSKDQQPKNTSDDPVEDLKAALHQKQASMKRLKEEFTDRGIMKAIYGKIENRVQNACRSTDHILIQKRSRLRELLLSEEVAYANEYVALCQQANASREDDLRKRAFELEAKAERERQQYVEEKRFELKLKSCDAARPTLSQKQLMALKQDQLWQIKEKNALEEARREEEKMYHDLMMKNILALKENEEENAKLAWQKQKDAQKIFIEQMKWKDLKEEQERRLKEFERVQMEEEVRAFKEAEIKEREELQQKKAKAMIEFKEMLAQERERKERRKREEEEIERTFNELLKLEAEKEKIKGDSNKERLKREMDIFLENNRALKHHQEEEERKCDQMLQELNEKKRQQKDAERRRMREAKEQLFCTVLKGREEQIKEKQERQRRDAERERAEIQLLTFQLEQQDKIREEYERKCMEQRREYQCQLLQQIEEVKETKKRKKEEEENYIREMKEKEEREIEELKSILKSLPAFTNDHPMGTIAREQPPKYPCLHPYM